MIQRVQIVVNLRQVLGELALSRGALRACRLDNRRGHPEPRRNLEREAASRRAVHQAIRRREGVGVEAEGGARHTVDRRRVGLQRVVMRRRHDERAARLEKVDDRRAQRAAVGWIGAAADLVEENQGGRCEGPIHRRDVGHVRRERAQARGDRLLVADVGEDGPEDRHPRPGGRRDVEARLRHERQEPRGLQRDRLAARVRTGDHERLDRRDEQDVDRNRSGSFRVGDRWNQQRMARAAQLESAVRGKRRLDPVAVPGEPSLRLQDVELGGDGERAIEVRAAPPEPV